MYGLILRLAGYVLIAVGLRQIARPMWARYRPRVVLALKVASVLWLAWALFRLVAFEHTESQWWALGGTLAALGAVYGLIWLVGWWVARRRALRR